VDHKSKSKNGLHDLNRRIGSHKVGCHVEKISTIVKYQQKIHRQVDHDEKHQEQSGDAHQKFAAN
jgi:hypothetical protein